MMNLDGLARMPETLSRVGSGQGPSITGLEGAPQDSRRYLLNALPFDNSFARLPTSFYRRSHPQGMPVP
jgi:hypothetical protein